MSRLPSLFILLFLPLSLMAARAAAEEPVSDKAAADAERARHLERMRAVAGSIRVLADPKRAESAVKLKQEPVLRYADSTRQAHEASLWIWSGGAGRRRSWRSSITPQVPQVPRGRGGSMRSPPSPRSASPRSPTGTSASPRRNRASNLQTLPDAPPPAEKEVRRLAQMKELRGRFLAYEKATVNGRIELRPLVTPLHRYSAPKEGLLDGAIFALASGTNPEVLLVLEAHEVKGKPAWQYALVHMTGEAVTVQLDGKEVWQKPGDNPPAVRASYINGWIETTKEEK